MAITANLAAAILSQALASALRITHREISHGVKPKNKTKIAVNTFSRLALGIIF
jgi:hypothetical protein